MGPGSVDSWLAAVVAEELGIPAEERESQLFDPDAQELHLPTGRVALTPLECGVMAALHARAGRPVSRADLLERVWGYGSDASSNVVDAVVVALRRKLGEHAGALETVRGTGYRLRT
jgi:DNA-binding response OmpR family regulator